MADENRAALDGGTGQAGSLAAAAQARLDGAFAGLGQAAGQELAAGLGKGTAKAAAQLNRLVRETDSAAAEITGRLARAGTAAQRTLSLPATGLERLRIAAENTAGAVYGALEPALNRAASAAAGVLETVAALLRFVTGKSVSASAAAAKGMASVGSSAGSTAKQVEKAAKSLAGFDEIERLGAKDSADAGGGGGGGTTPLPNYDFKGKSPFLEDVLAAIGAGQWYKVGELVAEKLNEAMAAIPWPNIQDKARLWASNLAMTLNGFVAGLNWGLLGNTIGNGLNTALGFIDTFFQRFNWQALGQRLGIGLDSLFATIDWEALGRVLTDKLRAQLETLHGFLQSFDFTAFGSDLYTLLSAAFANIDWAQAAGDLSQLALGVLSAAQTCLRQVDWASVGSTVLECLRAVDWGGIITTLFNDIGLLIGGLAGTLLPAFEDLGDWIGSHFEDCGENGIQGFLDGMWSLLCDIGTWIYDHMVKPLVDGVKEALGIHSPSTVFAEIGDYLVQGLHEGIEAAWETITGFFATSLEDIKTAVSDAWDDVCETTGEVWDDIGAKIGEVWDGITGTIKGAVNAVIGFVNGMISAIVGGLNAVIGFLNKLSIPVPEWAQGALGGATAIGFHVDEFTAPQIPLLANGGVIEQPTLAMMGEYAGAGNNPEIAAPQSVLKETMAQANGPVVEAIAQAVESLIRAMEENGGDTVIGDEVIGRACDRYRSRQAVMKGGLAF